MSAKLNLPKKTLEYFANRNISVEGMSLFFNCSVLTIKNRLKQYKLYDEYYERMLPTITKQKLQNLLNQGLSTKHISYIFRRKPLAINRHIKKYNIQRPKPQQRYMIFHEELNKLICSGKTLNEIADYYGCSRSTIEKRCREYELMAPKRNVPRHKSFKPYTMANGYAFIYLGHDHPWADRNGRIREHIYIMQKHIGRKLKQNELVHHKNGARNDNRLENLELCTNIQPPSQRMSDMIQFCEQYLKEYAPEKLRGENDKC